jgi:hypothetical protein
VSISDLEHVEARSTRGTIPVYQPLLNGVALDVNITEAGFVFTAGEHDQVMISANSPTLDDTEGFLDSTLSFLFGTSPRMERFSGYITNVTEEQNSAGSLSFSLTVLGATKAMYEGTPRFWTDKTIPNAVRDLTHRNLLGYSGHAHTHLWKGLAQTVESDWMMARSLTRRIGWSLFNRYGVVLCQDPLFLFTDIGPYARLQSGSDTDVNTDRVLIEFEPTETAEALAENLGTKYGFFTTSSDVQIGTQPGTFKGYRFDTSTVIRDQTESATYLAALDHLTDDWSQHAMARIWGDADIYPGMSVEVVTTNTRFLRDKYDGKWLVKAVAHQMDRQQYQTLLYLCRPGNIAVKAINYTPFWVGGDSNGRSKPFLTIEQGKWVSSWTDRQAKAVL